MNTGHSQAGRGLCSWVPGSRAAPAPRNDEYLNFLTAPFRREDEEGAPHTLLSECIEEPALVATFVRAVETSHFERRLQVAETGGSDHWGAVTGMCRAESLSLRQRVVCSDPKYPLPGLGPGIHAFVRWTERSAKTWVTGTSPVTGSKSLAGAVEGALQPIGAVLATRLCVRCPEVSMATTAELP